MDFMLILAEVSIYLNGAYLNVGGSKRQCIYQSLGMYIASQGQKAMKPECLQGRLAYCGEMYSAAF